MDLSVLKGKDPAGYLAQKGIDPSAPAPDRKTLRLQRTHPTLIMNTFNCFF